MYLVDSKKKVSEGVGLKEGEEDTCRREMGGCVVETNNSVPPVTSV